MRYIKQNAKGGIEERSILNDKKRKKNMKKKACEK